MTHRPTGRTRRAVQRAGAVAAVLTLSTVAWASPALAATTSQSTAQAINGTLLGGPLLSTAVSSAQNDGTGPTITQTFTSPLSVLAGQGVVNTGAVAQTAVAGATGTSAACAGAVGSGGALTVGDDGACTLSGATAPLLISLGSVTGAAGIPLPVTLTLAATAIYSQCTAGPSGTGPYTASSTLAGVTLNATALGLLNLSIPIDLNQPINLGILAPLLDVQINQTSSTGPTSSATALSVSLLGGALTSIQIGKVTCGENAVTAEIPMVPLKGAGVAGLTALLLGGGYLALRRRSTTLA